jgi:hypothetical protein
MPHGIADRPRPTGATAMPLVMRVLQAVPLLLVSSPTSGATSLVVVRRQVRDDG